MLASNSMHAHSHPLARLAAVAMVGAFLVAQSWIVCAPLCLLEGHATVAMVPGHTHSGHCHSDIVVSRGIPVIQPLASMLPGPVAQLLLPPRIVTIRFAPPASVHLQQIPPAEPPPPRSV